MVLPVTHNSSIPRQNGFAVRAIRELRGMKVAELAQRVGISDQHVRNIELEHRSATPEDLARIAAVLDIPVLALQRLSEAYRQAVGA